MCGRISPLGVFVHFGTMQVAGCRSGLAPDGGFGRLEGLSFADNPVLQLLNPRAVHSHYTNLHYVNFASPETALHRRRLVLASGFFVVFLIRSFFSVCDVAYPRAALIRACVPSHPTSTCFLVRGLDLFAPFFLFSLFCGGLFCLCSLRVRSGSVRFVAKCVTGAISSCRVPSCCHLIQAYINAVPSSCLAVIFMCRVGSISRSCTAIIVFHRRVPFNIRHFRGPCPMPRPFSLLRQHRYTAIRSVSSPFQSG